MNALSTATIEREIRETRLGAGAYESQPGSVDWSPYSREQARSDLWALVIALASNDGENESAGLVPALRRLREVGAQLVTGPDSDGSPTPSVRLTAGEMPEQDYEIVRRRHLMPHAKTLARLLRTAAFAATDPLTKAAIESGARVKVVGLV